jgi:ubiquinone/menaquinone biosynthesis C-methylase UbiE
MSSSEPSFLELVASLDIASLHPGGRKATKELLDRLGIVADDYVLDVGCGTARDLVELVQSKRCRAVGIDRSEKMVEMAQNRIKKQNLQDRITVLKGDAQNLPFINSNFDVVYIQSVLLQVDKSRVVRELARVLKAGGRYGSLEFEWSDEPDKSLMQRIMELTGEPFVPLRHEEWKSTFEAAGLNEYYSFFTKKAVVPYPLSEIVATEGLLNTLKGVLKFATLPLTTRNRVRYQTRYMRWIKENGKLGYAIYCYRK